MLNEIKTVRFEGDKLYKAFEDALADADPLLTGKLLTGTLGKSADKAPDHYYAVINGATDQEDWGRMWDVLGLGSAPAGISEDSMAICFALGNAISDTNIDLDLAEQTPGRLQLHWKVTHSPVSGNDARTGYAVLIMPKSSKSLTESYSFEGPAELRGLTFSS